MALQWQLTVLLSCSCSLQQAFAASIVSEKLPVRKGSKSSDLEVLPKGEIRRPHLLRSAASLSQGELSPVEVPGKEFGHHVAHLGSSSKSPPVEGSSGKSPHVEVLGSEMEDEESDDIPMLGHDVAHKGDSGRSPPVGFFGEAEDEDEDTENLERRDTKALLQVEGRQAHRKSRQHRGKLSTEQQELSGLGSWRRRRRSKALENSKDNAASIGQISGMLQDIQRQQNEIKAAAAKANAAQGSANSASQQGAIAKREADAAAAKANAAIHKGDQALGKLAAAQSQAVSAVNNARDAHNQAGVAIQEGKKAQQEASAAISNANGAKAEADQALKKGNEAISGAKTAQAQANSALQEGKAAQNEAKAATHKVAEEAAKVNSLQAASAQAAEQLKNLQGTEAKVEGLVNAIGKNQKVDEQQTKSIQATVESVKKQQAVDEKHGKSLQQLLNTLDYQQKTDAALQTTMNKSLQAHQKSLHAIEANNKVSTQNIKTLDAQYHAQEKIVVALKANSNAINASLQTLKAQQASDKALLETQKKTMAWVSKIQTADQLHVGLLEENLSNLTVKVHQNVTTLDAAVKNNTRDLANKTLQLDALTEEVDELKAELAELTNTTTSTADPGLFNVKSAALPKAPLHLPCWMLLCVGAILTS